MRWPSYPRLGTFTTPTLDGLSAAAEPHSAGDRSSASAVGLAGVGALSPRGFLSASSGQTARRTLEGGHMYHQDLNPVSDSLGLSSIFAALPLITLFVLLGGVRMKAQWAALISLGVAMLVALAVYAMPIDQTALSASEGATFGLFPIMWIVVAAIWVYNMTVETGHFAVLRRSFGA